MMLILMQSEIVGHNNNYDRSVPNNDYSVAISHADSLPTVSNNIVEGGFPARGR